ncbi:MAG: divergent polysaccharide deacetylase family protein [Magnetococcus sp. XQGC-1]
MNSPSTGGKKSLFGWVLLLAVAFLVGWGVALFVQAPSEQPPTEAKKPSAATPGPPPTAPSLPTPGSVGSVTGTGSLRLTLAEAIRVPRPPRRTTPARPERADEPLAATPAQPEEPPVRAKTSARIGEGRVTPSAPPVDSSILYEEPAADTKTKPPAPLPVLPAEVQKERKGKMLNTLAIIIDDLGYNAAVSRAMVALPADITLAILPKADYAREIARMGKAAGREILLHQPMEPRRYPQVNPGPGAMLTSMDMASIQAVLRANLAELPEVVGVNNHMGSRLTEDAESMDAVMAILSEKQLFFVDSRTSEISVGAARAAAGHVPTAARDVFLDNVPDEAAILRQLAQLERLARTQGEAIGIGHPYRETLAALQHWLPTLAQKGIRLHRVSRFLRPTAARTHYPDQQQVAHSGPDREE